MKQVQTIACLILLVTIGQVHSALAQVEDYAEVHSNRTDASMLSPSSSNFTNYVSHPMVNNSGMLNIDVPIYTLKDKDLVLDIRMNYDPNRLGVDNKATWIGTGWNLTAGGVITRQVKGKPDDVSYGTNTMAIVNGQSYTPPYEQTGYSWLSTDIKTPGLPGETMTNLVRDFPRFLDNWQNDRFDTYDPTHWRWKFAAGRALQFTGYYQYDLEPDIYSVVLNDMSFKFVFNEEGIPRILNGSNDYKIEYNQVNDYFNANAVTYGDPNTVVWLDTHINQFTITAPNGFIYLFNESEIEYTTKFERIVTLDGGGSITMIERELPPHPSAWYLSRMISPNGNEIEFTYDERVVYEQGPTPYTAGACFTSGSGCSDDNRYYFDQRDNLDDWIGTTDLTLSGSYNKRSIHTNTSGLPTSATLAEMDRSPRFRIGMKFLSTIQTDNVRIEFNSLSDRQDFPGTPELSEILVRDRLNGNSLVKDFLFDYSYETNTNTGIPAHWNKRLFLDSFYEASIDGDLRYDFEYNTQKLPHLYSRAKDAWGYFNNRDHNDLIPALYVYPNQTGIDRYRLFPISPSIDNHYYYLDGSDRTVHETAILAGTLSRIIFPTGGYRQYSFEPNEYWDDKGLANRKGGGLRLKEIVHHDGQNAGINVIRNYNYHQIGDPTKSSGKIVYPPILAEETNYYLDRGELWPSTFMADYTGLVHSGVSWSGSEAQEWNLFTKRYSHPINSLSGLSSQMVSYEAVTEAQPGNGRTEYTFHPPQTYVNSIADRFEALLMGCSYCDFLAEFPWWNNSADMKDYDPPGRFRRGNDGMSPYAPLSNLNTLSDLQSGKLLSRKVFKEGASSPLRETTYTYKLHSINPETVYGLATGLIDAQVGYQDAPLAEQASWWSQGRSWNVFSKYEYSTGESAVIDHEITREYDENGNHLETSEVYSYVLNYNLLRSKESFTPELTEKTTYRYVFDIPTYNLSVPAPLGLRGLVQWKDDRRINLPLQTSVRRDFGSGYQVVGGQLLLPMSHEYFPSVNSGAYVQKVLNIEDPLAISTLQNLWLNGQDLTYDENFTVDLEFLDYDIYGNVLEAIQRNGIVTSYEWGSQFNGAYLTQITTGTGTSLSQIQSFDYQPLIGVISTTDERGITNTYEYDALERLIRVKDQSGYTIKEYTYNNVNN